MPTLRLMVLLLVPTLLLPASARAYQADLVPVATRSETQDFTGTVSIGGSDGTVRVVVSSVNDAAGDPLDGTLSVLLRVRVNGQRRRVTVPLPVDTGDGEVISGLGLTVDDRVVVSDVRLRTAKGRTLAQAGALIATPAAPPPTTPPTPDQCPAALSSCESDLADCNTQLDDCESTL